MSYTAPIKDMRFVINEIAGLDQLNALPAFDMASPDLVDTVLEEAGRLAAEVLAPTNWPGDQTGTRVENDAVVVPEVFREAYRQFIEGGWPALPCNPEFDGQGLPHVVATAAMEMWKSANLAFSLCPMLTHGAVEALEAHGSEELRRAYLAKLITGEWTGTMNLTEPQAGSDLAAITTRAVPEGDHYRITGRKIYITWGDHDLTDNVIHLVLARLPDAPEGVKGISLFLVPKFLLDADGRPAERNDVKAVSVEHKLGIHGSPTCVMSYGDEGGAIGYLVGEENNGLACMFTMMNHARLAVGVEGLSISERAYQLALAYARDRVQGYVPGEAERVRIIRHPDVRRMLLTMKSSIEAMRAMAYVASASLDFSLQAEDPELRARHQARIDLLTPVVKGWCTELGQEMASLGVQIHGGMGYVEETGAAQHLRDARITTIYEGTTGIQANDLAGRKVIRDGGRAMAALLAEMRETQAELSEAGEPHAGIATRLAGGIEALEASVGWLLEHSANDPHAMGSAGVNLLMLTGTVAGGWLMGRGALAASRRLADGDTDREYLEAKLVTAQFYAEHLLPRAGAYRDAILAGSESMMALNEEQF
ncbi:MAG: acyl-CoA dehydrogenase [Gammaproteobacteria bacterium]|nr:MAG: acyl-CoA dehydrogenase [Gammaproteobacteria bacterium]